MSSVAAALPAGHCIAGHQVLRLLGSGQHGTVYLAQRLPRQGSAPAAAADADRPPPVVALKLVPLPTADSSSASHRTFLDAAIAAHRLRHRDIVRVGRAGIEGAIGWLAMEPVPGRDLGRYCHPGRLLPEALVLQVTARLARALAHAHRQGVVHRDVKPANVLVHWPQEVVKLGDFGLARVGTGTQTATGLLLGSPGYMAPEQLAGGVPSPRTDLYALGVTLFELLTGTPLHQADRMGELLRLVAQAPVPDLRQRRPALPASLNDLMGWLLAKNPSARPADGMLVAEALLKAARDLLPPAPPPVPSPA